MPPASRYADGGNSSRRGVRSGTLLAHFSHQSRQPRDWLLSAADALHQGCSVVIVTHNMRQAARVSDYTGFMLLGVLKEFGTTKQILITPKEADTENYISGRFG